MSLAAQGLYVRLLCFQWHSVHVLKDFAKLAIWLGCSLKEFEALWPEVRPKFIETPHGFYNKRLRRERGEYAVKVEQRRQAGKRSGEVRRKQPPLELAAPPPDDLAASQAEYAQNPPSDPPVFRPPSATAQAIIDAGKLLGPSATPSRESYEKLNGKHAAPLINGRDIRRHGQHSWCSTALRDGFCVPRFLHLEILGASQKTEGEVFEWYHATIQRYDGVSIGDDPLTFWRNEKAQWLGTVTASPDTDSKSARTMAAARRVASGNGPSLTDVFRKVARPS